MKGLLSKYFWIRQALFCSVMLLQSAPLGFLIPWSVAAGVLSVLVERKENAKAGMPSWEAAFVGIGVDVRRLLIGFLFIPIPFVLIGWWLVSSQFDSPNFGFFFGLYCFFAAMVLSAAVRSTSQVIQLARASK